MIRRNWEKLTLHKKCPNTEFFLVRIFLYSDRIRENKDQQKLLIWTLFTQCKQFILTVYLLWSHKIDSETSTWRCSQKSLSKPFCRIHIKKYLRLFCFYRSTTFWKRDSSRNLLENRSDCFFLKNICAKVLLLTYY